MVKNFRRKIVFVFLFVLSVLALVIFYVDHQRMEERIVENNEQQVSMIKESIVRSLSYVDRAYYMFDEKIAEDMKKYSNELVEKYETTDGFDGWNFEELKDQYGMDVYIVDEENTITHSSFKQDIGLNFNECCEDFATLLDERRNGLNMSHDGLDVQQKTGEIKKFSYMPTPDHKYLIELGYSLKDSELYEQFNFLSTTNELVSEYEKVENISIYNKDGYLMGKEHKDSNRLQGKEKIILDDVLERGDEREWTKVVDGDKKTFVYVPYVSEFERGNSGERVIKIQYNNAELDALVFDNTKTFAIQFALYMFVGLLLSYGTVSQIARPMYLAFHDSLTGAKNRAYFDTISSEKLKNKGEKVGFLLIDLDNFKKVNDELGHDRGDTVLRHVAKTLKSGLKKGEEVIRLGGDEFMIVLEGVHGKEDLEKKANKILSKLNTPVKEGEHLKEELSKGSEILRIMNVTASIGGAVMPEDAKDVEEVYKKADIALYKSKEKGKNQYVYIGDIVEEEED